MGQILYIGNPHHKEEWATIPVLPLTYFALSLSVWSSRTIKVNWGDGNITNYSLNVMTDATTSNPTAAPKSYSPQFSGDIKITISGGLKNVYSLGLFNGAQNDNRNRLNIDDFGEFINQFPNLYSLNIQIYNYQNASYQGIVSGNLAEIPPSLKRYRLKTLDTAGVRATFNINTLPSNSQLEWLLFEVITGTSGNISKGGDLKLLPPNIKYFKDETNALTNFTYTSGRVWRSDFDTIHTSKALTTTENDNILIDLAASVTSAVGDKVIRLRGARTTASDTAVLYLESLGFSVTMVA